MEYETRYRPPSWWSLLAIALAAVISIRLIERALDIASRRHSGVSILEKHR